MLNIHETVCLNLIQPDFKGFYSAALTDEYRIGVWPIEDGLELGLAQKKLLELRVFNENTEYKWVRGTIGEKFFFRKLTDDEATDIYEEPMVEVQILDIDLSEGQRRNMSLPGTVKMSGGGSFYLPLDIDSISNGKKPCLIVKYYVPKYIEGDESTVHAYVKDWRLAGIEGVK